MKNVEIYYDNPFFYSEALDIYMPKWVNDVDGAGKDHYDVIRYKDGEAEVSLFSLYGFSHIILALRPTIWLRDEGTTYQTYIDKDRSLTAVLNTYFSQERDMYFIDVRDFDIKFIEKEIFKRRYVLDSMLNTYHDTQMLPPNRCKHILNPTPFARSIDLYRTLLEGLEVQIESYFVDKLVLQPLKSLITQKRYTESCLMHKKSQK